MLLLEMIGVATWDGARAFLKERYINNAEEKRRRADARERDELYEHRGDEYLERLVNNTYDDDENRRLRKAVIPLAKWDNVLARVVGEKATVYSEPARRRVRNDKPYQEFLKLISLDEIMRELNKLLVLHEDVWVQYRVRQRPGGKRVPAVDVISPALFWAISDPKDQTLHIATLLDQCPGGDQAGANDLHYRLWTDFETIELDAELRIINRESWPLGRMPGFLASTRPPTGKQRLVALSPSADLVAAQKSVRFQCMLLFKESKSSNTQTYLSGDTSSAVFGQTGDTERETLLPEGVSVQQVDRGMDLSQFRDNCDHIGDASAANHGVPPSVRHHRDSSSGAEVFLRRTPLRELRAQQILVFRRVERELAEVQSLVNGHDLPEFAFTMEDWGVDFGEVQQPLTAQEADAVFEKRRQLGLRSTVEEERARNPDLPDDAAAVERIAQRIEDEVERLRLQQELQRMNGGANTAVGTPTPQENGRLGAAAAAGAAEAEPTKDRAA